MTEAYGLSIPDQLAEVCTPARCAVIIYDMQQGIVPQISSGREVTVLCSRLLETARAGGYRVFFTRHFFLPNTLAGIWPVAARHGLAAEEEARRDKALLPPGFARLADRS